MRFMKFCYFAFLAFLSKVMADGKVYLALTPGVSEVSVQLDEQSTGSSGPIVLDQTQYARSRTFVLLVKNGLGPGDTVPLQCILGIKAGQNLNDVVIMAVQKAEPHVPQETNGPVTLTCSA